MEINGTFQIEQQDDLPVEIREQIPFEKAMTLLQSARLLKNPNAQRTQLDQAQAYLEQFVRDAAGHPNVGEANSKLAKILLDKARVEIWQANSPANEATKPKLQSKARALVDEARKIFQAAHAKHLTRWKKFDVFIPPEEKQKREQRAKAQLCRSIDRQLPSSD